MLSIVIPVYNVKEYLGTCLSSLPSDVHIIIVNDGSSDGSQEICEEYASTNNNVFLINKKNGGLSDARNAAIPHIKTKYVFFLDSDDHIIPQNLIKALNFAISNDLDYVQCGYAYEYADHFLIHNKYTTPSIIPQKEALLNLINDSYIKNFAWGKIYRTSIVSEYLFPINKYYEDVLWQYQILSHSHRIGIYPDLVTNYRQRAGSISEQFSIRNIDLLEGTLERTKHIEKDYPELSDLSAFKLWKISEQCFNLSKKHKEIEPMFHKFHTTILSKYNSKIKIGISSLSLLYRLYYRSKLNNSPFYPIFKYAYKISEHFRPKTYIKYPKHD